MLKSKLDDFLCCKYRGEQSTIFPDALDDILCVCFIDLVLLYASLKPSIVALLFRKRQGSFFTFFFIQPHQRSQRLGFSDLWFSLDQGVHATEQNRLFLPFRLSCNFFQSIIDFTVGVNFKFLVFWRWLSRRIVIVIIVPLEQKELLQDVRHEEPLRNLLGKHGAEEHQDLEESTHIREVGLDSEGLLVEVHLQVVDPESDFHEVGLFGLVRVA